MAALILPSRRVAQPQGPVDVDGGSSLGNALGFHVSDFSGRDVVGQRFVTRSASLAYGVTSLGRGFSSAANAAFSAALDLSSTTEITVAFILKRNSATGTQVLVEHTINQNSQAGSFLIYTDTTNFLASISNGLSGVTNFNVASCAAPAVGRTTRVVVTLARRGTSAQACRIWYDGVEQVTSQPNTGSISGAFANSTTYFFGRAASSLFTNGVIHDISLWRRGLTDNEARDWSANPWRVLRPLQRRIWVAGAGGGAASQTVAFTLEDVSASVSQNLSHAQSLTGTLDDVTVLISQTAQHSQALSATLDDIAFAASQTVGNATNQTLAVTLDGVTVAAAQTLNHSQALAAGLDGVTVAASQRLSHSQVLAATLDGITVAISQSAAPSQKDQSLAVTLDDIEFDAVQIGALPAVGGMGFVFTDTPSALWWKRKPKALSDEVAEQKVNRVVRVIKEIAGKQQPEQTKKQAQREVAQAVAPLIAEMPGFDWTPIYRNIVADFERQREEAARIEAVTQIARIRALEQDDEDVLILLMSL